MPSLLDKAFDYLFHAYIFLTIFLLSGSIYGVNVYMPMCLLIFPVAVYALFRRKRATPASLAITLLIPTVLSLWVLLGLAFGFEFEGVKAQSAEILLTLFNCWLIYVFSGRNPHQQWRFLRLVLASVLVSALFKSGIILYALTHNIPVPQMVQLLDKVFGSDLMTMDLGDLFGRIQFAADALIPVCIFLVLRHRDGMHLGSLRAAVSLLLLFASVLFSFSRYYWAFSALAFVLGLLLGKRDRFQAVVATLLGVTFLACLPALANLYELRFSEGVAGSSDMERTAQIPALEKFFLDSPLIGHGLGSYTTLLLRAAGAGRHNYEVQLLALLGQVGLLGVIGFVVLLFWYFDRLWWKSPLMLRDRLGVALLLFCWIAGGFSNPLLFNPIAAIVYAVLAHLAELEAYSGQ